MQAVPHPTRKLMKHFAIRPPRAKWGLGLVPSNIVVPQSGVAVVADTGPATAPMAYSGSTITGYGGWSVTVPKNTSSLTPEYAALIDLITGDCPDIARSYGMTPQQVASYFNISASDLANLQNYAASIGMGCEQAAAPGVLTQPQLQQVIETSQPAASQTVPTWAETSA